MNDQIIESVKKHLKNPNNSIGVSQNNNKLDKGTDVDRYNFSMDDILNDSPTVEAFLMSIKDRGFSNGAELLFKKSNGSSARIIGRTILSFSETTEEPTATTTQQQQPTMSQHSSRPGLGHTGSDDLIDLKIKAARYDELLERMNQYKSEAADAKKALGTALDEKHSLQKKMDTIEERHELKKMKWELEKKSWYESDTIKEALGTVGGMIMQHQMGGGSPAPDPTAALAAPAGISPGQLQFATELGNLDLDENSEMPLVLSVAKKVKMDPSYKARLIDVLNVDSDI